MSDVGNIKGIDITNETVQNYVNQIKQNTQPSVIVDIDEYTIEENNCVLIIDVKEQPTKPISYKNKYFKRVKSSNHLMSLNEIANEHLKAPKLEEFQHGFKIVLFKKKGTTQETKYSTRELIIKYIKQNNKITRDELAVKIGVSANAIKQHLAKLKDEKVLKRVGSTKSGYWSVDV